MIAMYAGAAVTLTALTARTMYEVYSSDCSLAGGSQSNGANGEVEEDEIAAAQLAAGIVLQSEDAPISHSWQDPTHVNLFGDDANSAKTALLIWTERQAAPQPKQNVAQSMIDSDLTFFPASAIQKDLEHETKATVTALPSLPLTPSQIEVFDDDDEASSEGEEEKDSEEDEEEVEEDEDSEEEEEEEEEDDELCWTDFGGAHDLYSMRGHRWEPRWEHHLDEWPHPRWLPELPPLIEAASGRASSCAGDDDVQPTTLLATRPPPCSARAAAVGLLRPGVELAAARRGRPVQRRPSVDARTVTRLADSPAGQRLQAAAERRRRNLSKQPWQGGLSLVSHMRMHNIIA